MQYQKKKQVIKIITELDIMQLVAVLIATVSIIKSKCFVVTIAKMKNVLLAVLISTDTLLVLLDVRRDNRISRQVPPENVYKINVDAALSIEHQCSGIGIIIRDYAGLFMAGRILQIQACTDPHRAELLAAREGLPFAWENGFQKVILEGDARKVYDSIERADDDMSYNGSILRDIVMYAS